LELQTIQVPTKRNLSNPEWEMRRLVGKSTRKSETKKEERRGSR